MSTIDKALELLKSENYTILGQDRWKIQWSCHLSHSRWQRARDIVRGSRCAQCRRLARTPRKPIVVQPGAVVGDLVCLEYLGVVEGHSRVRVRNQTNGREAVMVTNQFLNKKWKLLTPEECRALSSKNGLARKGLRNSKNSTHTFADLRRACTQVKFEFLSDEADSEPLFNTRIGDVWLFRCFCGREFKPQINNIMTGNTSSCGCVKSRPQTELYAFVKSICGDAELNDRQQLSPLELDIWIASKHIAIEFSGLYWHGEALLGTKARTRHLDKLKQCEGKGIRLITIFEDEWLFKRPQVEAYLSAILGQKTKSIGARKCELVWDSKTDLAAKWHLQGKGRGTRAALKYGDDIVAEAIFCRPDASRSKTGVEGVWELNRFVIAPSWNVPGALGRLIGSFWQNTPDAQKLLSYSDNRWSQGGVYNALGFNLSQENPPSFWWFKNANRKRFHRFTYRASRVKELFPGGTGTAWETMKENGWNRIWDCGTKRWELHKGQ